MGRIARAGSVAVKWTPGQHGPAFPAFSGGRAADATKLRAGARRDTPFVLAFEMCVSGRSSLAGFSPLYGPG